MVSDENEQLEKLAGMKSWVDEAFRYQTRFLESTYEEVESYVEDSWKAEALNLDLDLAAMEGETNLEMDTESAGLMAHLRELTDEVETLIEDITGEEVSHLHTIDRDAHVILDEEVEESKKWWELTTKDAWDWLSKEFLKFWELDEEGRRRHDENFASQMTVLEDIITDVAPPLLAGLGDILLHPLGWMIDKATGFFFEEE